MEEKIIEDIWKDKKVQQIPVVYVCDVLNAVFDIIKSQNKKEE